MPERSLEAWGRACIAAQRRADERRIHEVNARHERVRRRLVALCFFAPVFTAAMFLWPR